MSEIDDALAQLRTDREALFKASQRRMAKAANAVRTAVTMDELNQDVIDARAAVEASTWALQELLLAQQQPEDG